MEEYHFRDVFTPTKPARATFVEREGINEKLVSALLTPGKQIVVYGHSGSGKTTLLVNKLHQFYENHITTRCVTGMKFEQLVLDAFDQLDPFYASEKEDSKSFQVSPVLQTEYAGIKAQLGAGFSEGRKVVEQRVLPPQLSPQTLARFLGEAKCCWVLEDFHKIESSEKVLLAQVMKLFMDMSDRYDSLKIIAIGAVDTARQVVQYEAEMRNRVAEIQVELMKHQQLRAIIDKGEELLNFHLPNKIKSNIVHYSNGLASVCHQLCFNICFSAGITTTLPELITISDSELDKALNMYMENATDTLKNVFDKAFRQIRKRKYANGRLILSALVKSPQIGATHAELLAKIREFEPKYPPGNLTLYLKQLQTEERGAIVRHDSASGRYSFSDPVYRAYALALFQKIEQIHAPLSEIFMTEDFSTLLQGAYDALKSALLSKNG